MDSQNRFCHNSGSPDRGQSGRGNIRIHSRKEQRYQCRTCGWTFAVALLPVTEGDRRRDCGAYFTVPRGDVRCRR
jgi:transposase-like protein